MSFSINICPGNISCFFGSYWHCPSISNIIIQAAINGLNSTNLVAAWTATARRREGDMGRREVKGER